MIGSFSVWLESLETLLTEKDRLTVTGREIHVLINNTLDLLPLEPKPPPSNPDRVSNASDRPVEVAAENCETAIANLLYLFSPLSFSLALTHHSLIDH